MIENAVNSHSDFKVLPGVLWPFSIDIEGIYKCK